MIMREWQTVTKRVFTAGLDDYGQPRQNGKTDSNVEMVIKIYNQVNNDNPKYVDIVLIGITEDKTITDADQIVINQKPYNVKYVIPSGRYLQVLLSNE